MTESPAARRALRDLLPATLATGAAGLVVALVVGGTSEGLRAAFVPATRDVPTYATGLPPGARGGDGLGGDRVTVTVRPSAARGGAASILDLVPDADAAVTPPLSVVAVRGVRFERATDALLPAGATAPMAAPAPDAPPDPEAAPAVAPPTSASTVVAAAEAPAKRRGTLRATISNGGGGGGGGGKAKPGAETTVAVASTQPVPLDAAPAPAVEEPERQHGRSHEAPPPHAPAYGYRTR